jgi:tetratricopeptide (TPR) repeat protein
MFAHLLRDLRRKLGGAKDASTSQSVSASGATDVLIQRGETFFVAGDHERAGATFRELLAADPRNAVALHALGVLAQLRGDPTSAVSFFTKAIHEQPGVAAYHNNCGEAYRTLGDLEHALQCYDSAIALAPDYVHPRINRGLVLAACARYEDAIDAYEDAIRVEPESANAHLGLATTLLTLERYERGWQEYAWRRAHGEYRSIASELTGPPWNGGPLPDGTVLLYAEQGFGDAIQFVRYAPLVAERCAHVLIKCHADLDVLFASMCGPTISIVRSGTGLPPYDAHASLLDLPALFCTTAATIPATVPYLAAPRERVEGWHEKLGQNGERLRVGIAWAGSARQQNNRNRSCTLADFAPLSRLPNIEIYSLQKETAGPLLWPTDAAAPLIDVGARIGDFADTAAIIENLDLVITVDTSVAHLAGALGRPAWTMLSFAPDWRWLTRRLDSPWYPRMRLFRQRRAGDWSGVFEEAANALGALARTR